MSEYIKREDALKKAISVKQHLQDNDGVGDASFTWISAVPVKEIAAIPAADVAERSDDYVRVVRCKNCALKGVGAGCKPKWRGQPQDGEGTK